jgi:hypothetical protein
VASRDSRDQVPSPLPQGPHCGSKSSFSNFLLCTTIRRILVSSSTNQGPAKAGLIRFMELWRAEIVGAEYRILPPPLSLSHTLSVSLYHTLSLSHTHTLTHSFSLTHTLTLADTHSLSLIHSHSLRHSLCRRFMESWRAEIVGAEYCILPPPLSHTPKLHLSNTLSHSNSLSLSHTH